MYSLESGDVGAFLDGTGYDDWGGDDWGWQTQGGWGDSGGWGSALVLETKPVKMKNQFGSLEEESEAGDLSPEEFPQMQKEQGPRSPPVNNRKM